MAYSLYVNSRDREFGDNNNFEIAPFGFFSTQRSYNMSLTKVCLPNTVPTVVNNVNNKAVVTTNGVDKSSVAIPEGYYDGTSYAAALKTWIDSVASTALNNSTCTYSTLTNKITLTMPSDVAGTGVRFSATNRYNSDNKTLSSTERFLQLAGFRRVFVAGAANASDTLLTTFTSSQILVGESVVKLNGTNYVDILTNMFVRSYSTASGSDNILCRVPLTAVAAATIQNYDVSVDYVACHVVGSDFKPRFILVDEWGDLFRMDRSHDVSLVFKLDTAE